MRYYKKIEGDFLLAIGTGVGGEEITNEEYEHILSVIRNCPTAEPGYQYRLKADLAWELVEAPAADTDPEISDAEALAIILGGET
jgi:hypothetical protein